MVNVNGGFKESQNSQPIHHMARILGPGTAGIMEIAVFHPVDTTAKRLMSYRGTVVLPHATAAQRFNHVHGIILRDSANATPFRQFLSLYPGIGFAVTYKIAQRIYKFGGQPFVKDLLRDSKYHNFLRSKTDEKKSRIVLDATAGAMVGIGEVMLLPMDVLKIKAQTNPEALAHRTVIDIIKHENWKLFAGASWTLMRNIPGSLALFGSSSAVKELVLNVGDRTPTLYEIFVSSTVGSFCSLVASSPFDVVKTRIQNQPFSSNVTGTQIVRQILKHEGVTAFARGLTPKLLTVGPKLICSFTAAQYFTHMYANLFRGIDPDKERKRA